MHAEAVKQVIEHYDFLAISVITHTGSWIRELTGNIWMILTPRNKKVMTIPDR